MIFLQPESGKEMYGTWLPDSGFMPEDGPSLELYHNNPEEHPEKKHILDICIPVRPA